MAAGNEARLAEALALVSARLEFAVTQSEPLPGGLTNHTWRIDGADRSCVLRLSGGREGELGIDRDSELAALGIAAESGLAPAVLLAEPAAGVLVTALAPGNPWTASDARLPRNLQRIARWFAALHLLPPPAALRRLSMRDALADLSLTLARRGRDTLPEQLYDQAAEHCERLDDTGPATFCHNDVHHLNVIDDGNALLVVDWEYAGHGEAVVDLAEFAAAHSLDAGAAALLVDAYRQCGGRLAATAFESARWLAAFRALLWLEVRLTADSSVALALAPRRETLLEQLAGG